MYQVDTYNIYLCGCLYLSYLLKELVNNGSGSKGSDGMWPAIYRYCVSDSGRRSCYSYTYGSCSSSSSSSKSSICNEVVEVVVVLIVVAVVVVVVVVVVVK